MTWKDLWFPWEAPPSPGSPQEGGARPNSPPPPVLTRCLLCAQPVLGIVLVPKESQLGSAQVLSDGLGNGGEGGQEPVDEHGMWREGGIRK